MFSSAARLSQDSQLQINTATHACSHLTFGYTTNQVIHNITSTQKHIFYSKISLSVIYRISIHVLQICKRERTCRGEPAMCENNRRIPWETQYCVINICYHNRGQVEENTQNSPVSPNLTKSIPNKKKCQTRPKLSDHLQRQYVACGTIIFQNMSFSPSPDL